MKKLYVFMLSLLGVAFLLAINAGTGSAAAAPAAGFYKGKVIDLVLPHGPGGGTDTYARMLGPYIERYTGATVVIKNMPGAGGIYSMNYLYTSKPNGLTIGMMDVTSMILSQLMKEEGVRYDFKKLNWLGRIAWSKRVILVGKNSPYHTLKDMQAAKRIKVGVSGKISRPSLTFVYLAHALDWPPEKLQLVIGYTGGKDLMMSVMQEEVDATSLTEDTSAEFAKQGLVRAFMTVDQERSHFLPDVPTPYEQVKIPKEKDWPLATYVGLERLGRGVITAPGVAPERVNFLREVFDKVLKDKDLRAKAAKVNRDLMPMTGKEMEKEVMKKFGLLSDKQIAEFGSIAREKYTK